MSRSARRAASDTRRRQRHDRAIATTERQRGPRHGFHVAAATGLRLLKHQEGVGVHPILLHRLGSLVALHRFLKLAEVGDLEE